MNARIKATKRLPLQIAQSEISNLIENPNNT